MLRSERANLRPLTPPSAWDCDCADGLHEDCPLGNTGPTTCREKSPTYGHSRPKVHCTTCGVLSCNGCLRSGSNQCIPCWKEEDT